MIKAITLILLIGCFTVNANAVSGKELIKKIPAFLFFTAIQYPHIMSKAIDNADVNHNNSNPNVTLALVYQKLLEMNQHILKIEQKTVNEHSDYKLDQLASIGITTVAIIGLLAMCLVVYIYFECCNKNKSRSSILPNNRRRYGLNS